MYEIALYPYTYRKQTFGWGRLPLSGDVYLDGVITFDSESDTQWQQLAAALDEIKALQVEVAQMMEFIDDMPGGPDSYNQWIDDQC